MEEVQLAYVAGLLDGEGCILIGSVGRNFQLHVFISNTYLPVLEYIQEDFGGFIRQASKGVNKPVYRLEWASCEAADLLNALMPYLFIKAEQAEVAVQFQGMLWHGRNRNDPLTEAELILREGSKSQIHKLNHKAMV